LVDSGAHDGTAAAAPRTTFVGEGVLASSAAAAMPIATAMSL